jgi:hypothetical protein
MYHVRDTLAISAGHCDQVDRRVVIRLFGAYRSGLLAPWASVHDMLAMFEPNESATVTTIAPAGQEIVFPEHSGRVDFLELHPGAVPLVRFEGY